MDKLSKILLCIVVILVIALVVMSTLYFKMKKAAKDNLNAFLNSEAKIVELIKTYPELQDFDFKALENNVNN
ncbi:unknown [Clostridium sp. CAG:798]|mgnify:FL=1|jgi:hypothetical protein|nr:unknown [Clostridium sp. CAG:798]